MEGAEGAEGSRAVGGAAASSIARLAEVVAADPRFARYAVQRPHPLLLVLANDAHAIVVAPSEVWDRGREILRPFGPKVAGGEAAIVLLGRSSDPEVGQGVARGLVALVAEEPRAEELLVAIQTGLALLEARARAERRGTKLNRYRYELGELIEISRALTTEREIDKLLGLILEKSRFITGADAGSIYVVEGDDPDPSRRLLRFKLTQNESVTFDSGEFTVWVDGVKISEKKWLRFPDPADVIVAVRAAMTSPSS